MVYTGIYLNEISRVDIAPSTFTADFYVWLRYATAGAGAKAADPSELDFPDLVRGSFDLKRPASTVDLDDGTTYRLWRIRGGFKNDFDLHHYPFDRQTLVTRFFNGRSASDQIVYVQDRRSIGTGAVSFDIAEGQRRGLVEAAFAAPPTGPSAASGVGAVDALAFRNLTQWLPVRADERRDSLVTDSGLGDPRLVGVAQMRELGGFRLEVEVLRRAVATLAKTLLPLGIMALIMFASLYFPHGLVKEKITVAVTGALSGAVLLASVNAQLGAVGYTIAVEYVFYVFFGLALLCIVSVLVAERLRVAGRAAVALRTEQVTRWSYLAMLVTTTIAAVVVGTRW